MLFFGSRLEMQKKTPKAESESRPAKHKSGGLGIKPDRHLSSTVRSPTANA